MKEIFKDIEGYEGLYQVSNLGRVKSLERKVNKGHGERTISEKILKQMINLYGYKFVHLSTKNCVKPFLVHRLVAQAFIPNQNNLPQVNHKDENPNNNHVDNLEWCDCKYNINYGTRTKRSSKKQLNDPNKSRPVLCVDLNKVFPSAKEAERALCVNNASIWKCCNGVYTKAGGYHWKYIEKEVI